MQFIEMSGKRLLHMAKDTGPSPTELAEIGVKDNSIVRVNRQGDIELRRPTAGTSSAACWATSRPASSTQPG